jgi:hypothetical protein
VKKHLINQPSAHHLENKLNLDVAIRADRERPFTTAQPFPGDRGTFEPDPCQLFRSQPAFRAAFVIDILTPVKFSFPAGIDIIPWIGKFIRISLGEGIRQVRIFGIGIVVGHHFPFDNLKDNPFTRPVLPVNVTIFASSLLI